MSKSPFLKIGQISANFNIDGNEPWVKELFINIVSIGIRIIEDVWIRFVGILFGPADFETFRDFIMSVISSSVQGLWRILL